MSALKLCNSAYFPSIHVYNEYNPSIENDYKQEEEK